MSKGFQTWETLQPMTEEQIAQAKSLRKGGRRGNRCWRVIAKIMGLSEYKIRQTCDPNYTKQSYKSRQSKQYEKKQYDPKKYGLGIRLHIPDEVLEERERRLNAMPQSLSAMLFGDPPSGYSALDKRHV